MIDALQNLVFAKPEKPLSSIKSLINQRGSIFTYALFSLVNNQLQSKSKCPIQNTHVGSNDSFFKFK